jgi:hypothetical protein
MRPHQSIDLTPAQAAEHIQAELACAGQALALEGPASGPLDAQDLDTALDAYVRALGLALQLGPAPAEEVLQAVVHAAQLLGQRGDAAALSALGPALVDLVAQVRTAGALPPTAIMEAWATVAADLGTLVGQVGLALALPPERQTGMMDKARARAVLLDDATRALFSLTPWIDRLIS